MGVSLTARQRRAVAYAAGVHDLHARYEAELAAAVREALATGAPILTLANALGVSRSRIRRLAR